MPEATPDDAAVPVLPLTVIVAELWPVERLDVVPAELAEDVVEDGPVLMVAEEDGNGADESQLRTSNATVPLIVIQ